MYKVVLDIYDGLCINLIIDHAQYIYIYICMYVYVYLTYVI